MWPCCDNSRLLQCFLLTLFTMDCEKCKGFATSLVPIHTLSCLVPIHTVSHHMSHHTVANSGVNLQFIGLCTWFFVFFHLCLSKVHRLRHRLICWGHCIWTFSPIQFLTKLRGRIWCSWILSHDQILACGVWSYLTTPDHVAAPHHTHICSEWVYGRVFVTRPNLK
jgi:hypothetical protein